MGSAQNLHYRPNEYRNIILKTLNCMISTQATNFVVMDCYHYCSIWQQKLFQQCTIVVVWCRMPTMCNSQPTMATIQSGTTTLLGPVSITTERDCTVPLCLLLLRITRSIYIRPFLLRCIYFLFLTFAFFFKQKLSQIISLNSVLSELPELEMFSFLFSFSFTLNYLQTS